jgi:hypothetical protein
MRWRASADSGRGGTPEERKIKRKIKIRKRIKRKRKIKSKTDRVSELAL